MMVLLMFALLGIGFAKMGKSAPQKETCALKEHKSFVFVLYSHNWGPWCQRTLQSVFAQDYNNYRVIVIDDASIDATETLAKEFIVQNGQDEKVVFIKNETHLGYFPSLQRAINCCLEGEIVIPIDLKDWLASPDVLVKLNRIYQNPKVFFVSSSAIEYPSYWPQKEGLPSFYASLFRQASDLHGLKQLAKGKTADLNEPLLFSNKVPF